MPMVKRWGRNFLENGVHTAYLTSGGQERTTLIWDPAPTTPQDGV